MNRQLRYTFLSLLIVTSLILQPFLGAIQPSVVQAQSDSNTVYLPVVAGGATNNAAPPQFEISSPITGSTLSRVFNFAIQPISANEISSVTFKAGNTTLGSDISSADGFSIFVDASNMVTGTVQLSAIAKGPGGESTKTVTISVVPNPPSSAIVGKQSSVLATDIGSTIGILPNSLPEGATVSITELTQEQVTSKNGIRWDDIGVTFLGAQQIDSSAPFSRPLGSVVSAGFGNRVQPGQAIVNYRLGPDVDGDGAGEIVVVNTASVAPNGDVVGDEINILHIGNFRPSSQKNSALLSSMVSENIPIKQGMIVQFDTAGFNNNSLISTIARFHSLVDDAIFESPALASSQGISTVTQTVLTLIPNITPGIARVEFHDRSSGMTSNAISITIEAAPPLNQPAIQIVETSIESLIDQLKTVQEFAIDQGNDEISTTVTTNIGELQKMVIELKFDNSNPTDEFRKNLAFLASIFSQNTQNPTRGMLDNPKEGYYSGLCDPALKEDLDLMRNIGIGLLFLGFAPGPHQGVFLSAGVHLTLISHMARRDIARDCPCSVNMEQSRNSFIEQCQPPPCQISPNGPNGPTGMGSAPPPGGNGCGGIGGGGGSMILASSVSGTSPFDMEPGRYRIKVYRRDFSGNPLSPFTGVNDAGGYFFLPLIPQDEPFTAVAVDKQTGLAVTYDGIGPKEGTSTFMFFDFSDQKRTAFPIHIGDTISANVPISGAGRIEWPGTIDVYTFTASAGQFISFTLQSADFSLTPLRVRLQSPSGNTLVDTRFATGTSKNFFLPQAGDYTLTINEIEGRSKGEYQFTTFKLPVELFGIAIGDTIANHSPAVGAGNIETIGAKDIYSFSVPARQRLFFDLLDVTAVPNITWQLVDSSDTILFENPFSFGDPGVRTLVSGGIYTLTVGTTNIQTGTYSFKIWNVPDPQQFAISVGSTVSDGLPASGAGKIETPGTKDQYTFTASAGQHIYFDLITGLENIPWKAVDAKGSVIFEGNLTDGDPGERALSQGGTYTITVGSDFQATTGSYSFQIRNP